MTYSFVSKLILACLSQNYLDFSNSCQFWPSMDHPKKDLKNSGVFDGLMN